jgi:hypothetical protein
MAPKANLAAAENEAVNQAKSLMTSEGKKATGTPPRPLYKPKGDDVSFKSEQKKIASKEGVPMKNAGAILASASRNASPAAKRKNPKLKRVKGKAKKPAFMSETPRARDKGAY